MMGNLQVDFFLLREDIQKYLLRNMENPAYYLIENVICDFKDNRKLQVEYLKHKKALGDICGLNDEDNYSPREYDQAIEFVKGVMLG